MKKAKSSSVSKCIWYCIMILFFIILAQSYYEVTMNSEHDPNIARIVDIITSVRNDVRIVDKVLNKSDGVVIPTVQPENSETDKTPVHAQELSFASSVDLETQVNIKHKLLKWCMGLQYVMSCVANREGGLYFYHTRKAAGTTIRDWLIVVGQKFHLRLFESEGRSLNPKILEVENLLSVIAIRDPIDRILSLYWYEHVAWWLDVKHDMSKCRPLHEWVDGWVDGSTFKDNMVRRNPGTVYVEIENYYVKSLIGWRGGGLPLTERDLELAKQRLEQFHVVLLSESVGSANTSAFLQRVFGDGAMAERLSRSSNKGASNNKHAHPQLVSKQDEVVQRLKELNKYDFLLWEHAKSLFSQRFDFIMSAQPMKLDRKCTGKIRGGLKSELQQSIGLFQPPGHKGP